MKIEVRRRSHTRRNKYDSLHARDIHRLPLAHVQTIPLAEKLLAVEAFIIELLESLTVHKR